MRQDRRRDRRVIVDHVTLAQRRRGVEDLVEVREHQLAATDLHGRPPARPLAAQAKLHCASGAVLGPLDVAFAPDRVRGLVLS